MFFGMITDRDPKKLEKSARQKMRNLHTIALELSLRAQGEPAAASALEEIAADSHQIAAEINRLLGKSREVARQDRERTIALNVETRGGDTAATPAAGNGLLTALRGREHER